ncbi:MAG: integration host factor subunit beta [Syntrophaceae bacterium]|nr:MAG: integration host factor subunit beta [Syntrophaceae bacterium]
MTPAGKATMTKNELIKRTWVKFKIYPQKDIALAVQTILDSMVGALRKNERIEIRGFGTFTMRERKSRVGRNPKSGAEVSLDDRRVPFFKTGKELRLKVDDKK